MTSSKKRVVVCVIGMHRSGTSAITRGLQELSLELGDRLLPPGSDNKKGFYEDTDILAFNQRMLAKIGSNWGRLSAIDVDSLNRKDLEDFRQEARVLLSRKIPAQGIFAFKDPRTSILLPLWQIFFADQDLSDRYVVSVRDPLSVADSLFIRDGYPRAKGLALWAAYVMASLRHTQNKPRLAVAYDKLVENPERELIRIGRFLELPNVENSSLSIQEFAHDFMSRDLRHHYHSTAELMDPKVVPPFVKDLNNYLFSLTDLSPSVHIPSANEDWQALERRFLEFSSLFSFIDHREFIVQKTIQSKNALNDQLAEMTHKHHAGQAALDQALRENTDLHDRMKALSLDLSDLEKNLQMERVAKTAAEYSLQIANQRLAELAASHEALRDQLDETLIELHAAKILSQFEKNNTHERITTLEAQLRTAAQEANAAEALIFSLRVHYESVVGTFSWRITAPLRRLKNWAKNFAWRGRNFLRSLRAALCQHPLGALFFHSEAHPLHPPSVGGNVTVRDFNTIPELGDCHLKIAVHLHLYYSDLLSEFKAYLQRMPFPFTLLVSVPNESAKHRCEEMARSIKSATNFDIRVVPNRGRDIAPFCTVFASTLSRHDVVAHIHTKMSRYNQGATNGWRRYLLENLFGSERRLRQIFYVLQNEEKTGLIYPETFPRLPYFAHTWLSNRPKGRQWCARLGIRSFPKGYFDYPAGSMFFARTSAILPLLTSKIDLDDFDQEEGQIDGTLAHTVERLFGVIPLDRGFDISLIKDEHRPAPHLAWNLERLYSQKFDSLEKSLKPDRFPVVIFDIFDTLLERPLLDPEISKIIIADRAGSVLGEAFLRWRAPAEVRARTNAGKDVGLEEIYEAFRTLSGLSQQQASGLKALEENIESYLIRPKPFGIALIRRAKDNGQRVIIASDSYLSKMVLSELLNRCQINEWDALYVSSHSGMRKDTGSLYKEILKNERIAPDQALVVGDNESSDLQIPNSLGMKSLHLPKFVDLAAAHPRWGNLTKITGRSGSPSQEITLGIALRRTYSEPASWPEAKNMTDLTPQAVGYTIAGPLVLGFTQWLLKQATAHSIQTLYFVSREGFLLKKIYDLWSAGIVGAPQAKCFPISRRTAIVAALQTKEDMSLLTQAHYIPNTLATFLRERCGLAKDEVDWASIRSAGLAGPEDFVRISPEEGASRNLAQALEFLAPQILSRAADERPALIQALGELGLMSATKGAIVDIGYSATIQARLSEICGQNFLGLYMMTSKRAADWSAASHASILSAVYNQATAAAPTPPIYSKSFDLERLLSSDEAQILRYRLNSSGSAEPVYRPLSQQEMASQSTRQAVQEGIQTYALDCIKIRNEVYPALSPSLEVGSAIMNAFLANPPLEERRLLDRIFLDDYYCGRGVVGAARKRS